MSHLKTFIRTARVVTLLSACSLTVSAMAQQAQEGKAPEPAPKAEAPPAGSASAGLVVPGRLTAISKKASEEFAAMQKERENPSALDMPDAPLADQPKKP